MKKITLTLVSFLLVALTTQAEHVPIGVRSVHVPLGFDSNDDSEVEVVVELPSTCHRRPYGEVKVIDGNIWVDMKADKAPASSGIYCIQAIVPYLVSVPVGRLAEGNYQVVVNRSQETERMAKLTVAKPNTGSIDNFAYANVTGVKKDSEDASIYLEGYHPSSCMEIDRVEMIPNESGDTIAVLPIVKQSQAVCVEMIKPFLHKVDLANVTTSELVLHVRRIDGRALNFKL